MDEGIEAAVTDWEQRPLEDGLRGIHRLAERGFSGAIAQGETWLLLVEGEPVGVFTEVDGAAGTEYTSTTIEALSDPGTVYEAPDGTLPLLFAMRATGGEQRGRYYTGQRSLAETHRALERDGFTGYVELSEEVVSGDYYVVYREGTSSSVAFTGGERRVRTGEEAFDRADQEVGIYTITVVDLPAIELPAVADPSTGGAMVGGGDPPDSDDGPASTAGGGSQPPTGAVGTGSDVDPIEPSADDGAAAGIGQAEYEPATDPPTTEPDDSSHPAPGEPSDRDTGRSDHTAADRTERGDERVDRLEARVDDLAAEQERLAGLVADLREVVSSDRVAASGEADGQPTPADRDPAPTLSETTVLVRYRSDGGPRLETLGERTDSRDTLQENLQLEVRTPFDPEATTVDGQPFHDFLTNTLEHRFVRWLVSELPFDVREAGKVAELDRLDASFPSVDRATFAEAATVGTEPFDLVAWNREGDPLIVVRFEEGVTPPSAETTESFLQSATEAAEREPSVAAAVLVTTAYVNGESVGVTRDATRSSLLDRSRRESYVRTSAGGFHLCLVEAGESFHLAVPEL